jgi:organic radical activating enzyme
MFDRAKLLYSRLRTSQRHSGAKGGTPLLRLARQGLPYYLDPTGRALPPLTIFLVINGVCNLRCRMCDIGQGNEDSMFSKNLRGDKAQDFPFERFKTLVDEVAHFRPYLGVTTTEPLLYPHMFDAVAYARSRGLDMNISTNGVLLEKHVDAILESGLHRISISLDGPAAVHDAMRGVPGTYDRVVRGIERLAEEKRRRGLSRPEIYVTSFVCDTNQRHLVDFFEGLPLGCIDWVNVKLMVFFTKEMVRLHNAGFGQRYPATSACIPQDFSAGNMDIACLCEQAADVNRRFGQVSRLHFDASAAYLSRYFFEPERFMDATKCVLPWFVSQVTAAGDLITLTRCYNVTFGNIMDKPFLDAWNGPAMRAWRGDLRRHGRFPACARCDGVLYR